MGDERDPKVSERYRELGREEPPHELDQTILAAARRAADRPHAPLVAPAGRHRWYYAFGAAAILVLAITMTLQIDRERADAEALATAPLPPPAIETAPRVQQLPSEQFRDVVPAEPRIPEERPRSVAPARAPASIPVPSRREDAGLERQAAPRLPTAPADAAPRSYEDALRMEAARRAEERSHAAASSVKERSTAPVPLGRVADATKAEPPQRWLERIVQLRKDGKQDEADKQLAEFRRRYPGYKIPGAALPAAE